jgi:hypothetical protein
MPPLSLSVESNHRLPGYLCGQSDDGGRDRRRHRALGDSTSIGQPANNPSAQSMAALARSEPS